ncbi:MAG: hypothetical protein KJP07_14020 [Desulfatitalea sp.]|nr:hypothetical protein [Desulfatitalea sp.]
MMTNNRAPDSKLAECTESLGFSTAYATLTLFCTGPAANSGFDNHCSTHSARFDLDKDLSPLFPYINAVAEQADYYEKPVYIRFLLNNRLCAFYPRQGAFTPIRDMAEAMAFLPQLLGFITDVAKHRAAITPNQKKFKPVSALDIYRLLPGSNCRLCGYATCMAFAAALSRQRTSMLKCPQLTSPMAETATFPIFDDQGSLVRTVSLEIDTASLRRQLDETQSRIQALQSQLSDFENRRDSNTEAANAKLPSPLSRREIQVLRRIAGGATNKEISRELRISEHTVKSHVIHIFNKLGVNDRAHAAAWGALNGLI